jgi:uncharacterized membrane protein YfcA
MAGGGSLLMLPVLLFTGMPAALANGTLRVAILAQNIVATDAFHRKGLVEPRTSGKLALAAVPGAVAGALAATFIPDSWFEWILAGVMVVAAIGLFIPSGKRSSKTPGNTSLLPMLSMVFIGFYGGFIQAGVGMLFMLALYQLVGLDLVRVNAYKVFIVAIYTVPALAVFVLSGNVDWVAGVALGVGNATGAAIGARSTMKGGEKAVRWAVAVAVILMAVRLVSR